MVGAIGEVGMVTLAKIRHRMPEGVRVVCDLVHMASKRHLWSVGTHQFDLVVGGQRDNQRPPRQPGELSLEGFWSNERPLA